MFYYVSKKKNYSLQCRWLLEDIYIAASRLAK